jgi:hypothetical protein
MSFFNHALTAVIRGGSFGMFNINPENGDLVVKDPITGVLNIVKDSLNSTRNFA